MSDDDAMAAHVRLDRLERRVAEIEARERPRGRRLALAHFGATGVQDCRNVISREDFDLGAGDIGVVMSKFIAEHFPRTAEARDAWVAQHADDGFDGLDPEECWHAWRADWLATASVYVRDWLAAELAE